MRFQGLENFTEVYGRMGPYRLDLEAHGLELGGRARGLNLRAVEVRTAPTGARGLLDLATVERDAVVVRSRETGVEWGWTLHLLRSRGRWRGDKEDGTWLSRVLSRVRSEVRRCVRVFEVWPQLLEVFRGVDVAADELAGPMWTMIPAVRMFRSETERITARSGAGRPVQVTLHAGEDFSHPVTGLRHVHELQLWEVLRTQDRIGHAIALGVDPARYRGHTVVQPCFERFLDLCWLLEHVGRVGLWERELDDLREAMGMRSGHPMHELIGIHERLGRPGALQTWEAGQRPSGASALDDFLAQVVEAPAHEIRSVVVSRIEVEAAASLQNRIASELARMHVTIELNPSSNLMVAGLDGVLGQPLFARVRELGLKVTLSADDPLLLATSLHDEYAYAHAGLVESRTEPLTPTAATAWLEEAADASMRARFTTPASANLDDAGAPLYPRRVWRRP